MMGGRSAGLHPFVLDPPWLSQHSLRDRHPCVAVTLPRSLRPILCCPNDPDDARPLGDVAGTKIDEVGQCHIWHAT
eukprot:4808528-Amphidinium_carterae.1